MINKDIKQLIGEDAVFVANHSGGKDSQAMFLFLKEFIPNHNLIVIHAELPEVDWNGTVDHIRNTTAGISFEVVRANKTFFDMVRHRGMWPSPQYRQCTSDLKRGPIEKAIRRFLKKSGSSIVVNCMGIRAEESSKRARANVFKLNKRNSRAGRRWYDWLPIHGWTRDQVLSKIKESGERPHWAYSKGMTRLSCCFCIMASRADLRTSSRINRQLFEKYCSMERQIDHTFVMPGDRSERKFLTEIIS